MARCRVGRRYFPRGIQGEVQYNCWEVKGCDAEPFKTMIGETQEQSVPHIMFHCCKHELRKEAVGYIKRRGLLQDYTGPGVG